MAAERGASANTHDAYLRDMEEFSLFVSKRGASLLKADTNMILSYFQQIADAGFSPKTSARKLSSLRQFYKFLCVDGMRADNPTLSLDSPRQGRSLPKYLSQNEVETLLNTAHSDTSPEGLRLTALLELLYASGLRVTELVTLRMDAVQKLVAARGDRAHNFLIIRGKGNKERLVPLNHSAINAVLAYLQVRPVFSKKNNSKWVFASASKEGYLTRQRFGQLLKQLAFDANLDPAKVSPHVLRHSFASHLLHNGADLRVVQELLGHADISTTQIYTHVLDERMKALVNEKHPLAGKV